VSTQPHPRPPEQVTLTLPPLREGSLDAVAGDRRYDALHFAEADLSGLDLARATFAECVFERVGLHETDLRGAHLVESRLSQVDAAVFTAPRSSWRQTVLERSRLGAVETYETTWRSLLVSDCKLGYLNARGSVWTDVTLRGCSIDELDLSGAKLTRVAFADCRIGTLRAAGATLADVDLRGARLEVIDGLAGLAGAWVSEFQLTELAPLLAEHLKIRIG
jgi:uncharacterized protein YjbI with pentapeptide repeats